MKERYRFGHAAGFLVLVAAAVGLSSECLRSNPVMIDEYAHVPAGISYWDLGRHYIYRENPPLIRLLTALPVWTSSPRMTYARASSAYRSEWQVGTGFIAANGARHHELYVRARCVVLLLSILCGLLIFLWASENRGAAAGLVCASLWMLDPTVLANSAIATVDVGAALFGLGATFLFWRWLRDPSWGNAFPAGVGLGAAQACKFTMLGLYPAWLALWLLARMLPSRADQAPAVPGARSGIKLGVIFLLGLFVLDCVYAFDRVGRPLGAYDFKSILLTARVVDDLHRVPDGNRFRGTWLAEFPVPLPEDYIRGFDSQKWEEEWGFMRLTRGRLVHRGSWYSPLETLAYKLPLGTLALLAGSAGYWLVRSRRLCPFECVVFVPALFLLMVLSTQTGLNWTVRYAVPALPFLFLSVGGAVRAAWAHPAWRWGVLACVCWNGLAVVAARPHFLSYGNELVGGQDGARREFAGSNLDWGQDLYRLVRWRSEHADARPLSVLYYGALDPDYVGVNDAALPVGFLEGREMDASAPPSKPAQAFYLAISFNILVGQPANVHFDSGLRGTAFVRSPRLSFENAVARIGRTIYVFHVVPTAADVRSEKDVTFDELKSTFKEASFEENWKYTLL